MGSKTFLRSSWKVLILCDFLYPATLKSGGYHVIPSIQKIAFECTSVCLSELTNGPLLGTLKY